MMKQTILLIAVMVLFFACSKKTIPTAAVASPKANPLVTPKDTIVYEAPKQTYTKPIYVKPFDEDYQKAFSEIKRMVEQPEQLSFKRAVFLTENAYLNDTLNYVEFTKQISSLAKISKQISIENKLLYDFEDKSKVEIYAGTFSLMTEGVKFQKDSLLYQFPNFTYDFDDFAGNQKWQQMFVLKLLSTHNGNCHSLPFLYKILVEENGEKANLALAPNHIYIKHQIKKAGWYNTELTSGMFPVDAWLMASGFIKLEAIQNGIYMKALNDSQSISLCMIDLAQGYERKFGVCDGKFILKCCDFALQNFPNCINALILKAETLKKLVENDMKKQNVDYVSQSFSNPQNKERFEQMNLLYKQIHNLGYRKMPDEMYLDWLVSLKEEKSKYQNKNINFNTYIK